MKEKQIILWLFVLLVSRIPFLATGYGAEGDAWRIAETSLSIWERGEYRLSRFLGYPVYEFVNAPLIGAGGSSLSNFATFLVFLASLYILRKITVLWHVPHPGFLLVTFAFFPLVWKNSAVTMDYLWGLAGILAAAWQVLEKRFLLAGILVGLAAGTRISHLAFLLPLFLLIPREQRKKWMTLAVWAIGTTAVCYIPVIASFSSAEAQNVEFLATQTWASPISEMVGAFLYRIVYSVGLLGFASLLGVGWLQRRQWKKLMINQAFVFSLASIALTLLLFALWPVKREYLIPMVPFILIALFLLATRLQVMVTMTLLLSFSFFSIHVIDHESGSLSVHVTPVRGMVLKEYADRRKIKEWRERVVSLPAPDSSIVMTGMGPIFGLENPFVHSYPELEALLSQNCYKAKGREVYFVYSLNHPQLKNMRTAGFTIYYAGRAKNFLERFVGYRMEDERVPMFESIAGG